MLGTSSKDKERTATSRALASPVGEGASLIARAMRVVGDCRTDGQLRVEGQVTGDVTAGAVQVASSGSVDGDVVVREGGSEKEMILVEGTVRGAARGTRVEVAADGEVEGGIVADEAVIHGSVAGGILAERRLILEETAVVEGDVRARRLALKEGGQVNGNIRMGEGAAVRDREEESAGPAIHVGPEGPEDDEHEEETGSGVGVEEGAEERERGA